MFVKSGSTSEYFTKAIRVWNVLHIENSHLIFVRIRWEFCAICP